VTRKHLFLTIPILLLLLVTAWIEVRHHSRFHDLVGYGWHVDLVERSADLGIPGIRTTYAVWLTNYTVCPQIFEGIKLPGGYVGSGVFYPDRIERWDASKHSWITVRQTLRSEMPGSLVRKRIWPGQSIFASGWDAVAATDGIRKGDTVRIVVFSSFGDGETRKGQKAFYSPEFTIDEEPTVRSAR
jgi:hypothetical protein